MNNLALFVLLSFATWYGVFRIMVGWYNVFHIEVPEPQPPRDGLRVAIFTTSAPGEPYEMFVRTLGGDMAEWYRQAFYHLTHTYSRGVKAVVFFNQPTDITISPTYPLNWSITLSPKRTYSGSSSIIGREEQRCDPTDGQRS